MFLQLGFLSPTPFVRPRPALRSTSFTSCANTIEPAFRSGQYRHVEKNRARPLCMTDDGQNTTPEKPGVTDMPKRPEPPGFFGIRLKTNGDVIKFGFVAIAIVFAIKTGIQLAGVPDLLAGQLTTAFISIFALVAWVSTYFFRVGTKNMTYAQQLRDYEDAVIKKRYEELSEEELAALSEELSGDA